MKRTIVTDIASGALILASVLPAAALTKSGTQDCTGGGATVAVRGEQQRLGDRLTLKVAGVTLFSKTNVYVCQAQYPMDPGFAQDWTDEQLGIVYDYWEQYYIPCMEAHGHPVDDTDKPSRETYIAAFHTQDRLA